LGLAVSLGAMMLSAAVDGISNAGASQSVGTAAHNGVSVGLNSRSTGQKYKIVLSNSFTGNSWRIEMLNEFKAACAMVPISKYATCTVDNTTDNTVSSQQAQMSAIISEHPSAIVIDPASPTALNGVIRQACAQKILVVTFDDVSKSTASCAPQVNISDALMGKLMAVWLVATLHGKGNILMVTGLPGTTIDSDRNVAAHAVFKKYPGIHIVATYFDQWNSAEGLQKTAAVLPGLPSIQGAWVSGGTSGVLQAFTNAGRKLPPSTGEAENAFRQEIGQGKVNGYSVGDPIYLGAIALAYTYEILRGLHARTNLLNVPLSIVDRANSKQNVTWFAHIPAGDYAAVIDTSAHPIIKGLCLEAATVGKACPGKLSFNFAG
jgi:ribose transport system substrate-binding protein